MRKLKSIKAMVIDLDGVIWRGATPLPGVQSFFDLLRSRSIKFVLVTNNASLTPEIVCDRLKTIDVQVDPEHVLTSGQATVEFLQEKYPAGTQVYLIGEQALKREFIQAGFKLMESATNTEAVVIGLDRQCTWNQLAEAALAIQAGAVFIGTNPDVTFPLERGKVPGAGAILAALEACTGVQPMIIGKPEPWLYLRALKRINVPPTQALALGDRLETDILGGQRAGMATALVLTGVTQRNTLDQSSIKPDYVFDDLLHLCRLFTDNNL